MTTPQQADPPSEARQLADARTASQQAQVRIQELEAQVNALRGKNVILEIERDEARQCLHLARADLYMLTANYRQMTKARDAIIVQAHHWKREYKYFRAQLAKAYADNALLGRAARAQEG